MSTIVLNKGGTAEQTVSVSEITIPDLWHVAELLHEQKDERAADLVIECWSLTHSLLRHIQDNQ